MKINKISNKIQFYEKSPSVEEYQKLRNQVGWSKVNDAAVKISLDNSIYSVCLYIDKKIIGFGRIVGDKGIYYYIQDIIIDQEYRGIGLGKEIMKKIMNFLEENADPSSFIGLMAAKGYADFYKNFDFNVRDIDSPGMFRYLKPK